MSLIRIKISDLNFLEKGSTADGAMCDLKFEN
jgi:hypothetical protein